MNFRILYLVFVLVFGYLLFFSWSQENRAKAAAIAAVYRKFAAASRQQPDPLLPKVRLASREGPGVGPSSTVACALDLSVAADPRAEMRATDPKGLVLVAMVPVPAAAPTPSAIVSIRPVVQSSLHLPDARPKANSPRCCESALGSPR